MGVYRTSGTATKVRAFESRNGKGWSCSLKEDGEYGKNMEVSGYGNGPDEGDHITVTGEPSIKWMLYKAEIEGAEEFGDEIPFHHLPREGRSFTGHQRYDEWTA